MWNPAHRRTPNHGAAVRGTALLSLFSQSILKLPPSALLKDLGRGIGEETGKPGAEGIEPQTQVVRVSEAVSPFLIEGNQVVHRELIQITDEGGRGMPGLRFHIDEAAWALMEELQKDRALTVDPQRGDNRPIFSRERPRGEPTREPTSAMGGDRVFAREDVEVVPDRVERQVEPPRELPQVEARIALQELEDPVTRCQ